MILSLLDSMKFRDLIHSLASASAQWLLSPILFLLHFRSLCSQFVCLYWEKPVLLEKIQLSWFHFLIQTVTNVKPVRIKRTQSICKKWWVFHQILKGQIVLSNIPTLGKLRKFNLLGTHLWNVIKVIEWMI